MHVCLDHAGPTIVQRNITQMAYQLEYNNVEINFLQYGLLLGLHEL